MSVNRPKNCYPLHKQLWHQPRCHYSSLLFTHVTTISLNPRGIDIKRTKPSDKRLVTNNAASYEHNFKVVVAGSKSYLKVKILYQNQFRKRAGALILQFCYSIFLDYTASDDNVSPYQHQVMKLSIYRYPLWSC